MSQQIFKRKVLAQALLACVAVGVSLSGCAATDDSGISGSSSATVPDSAQSSIAVPAFAGPWADEFASAYRDAKSDFERKALEDGTIADSEFAEMQNKFKNCLGAKKITFTGFKVDGSFEFGLPSGMSSGQGNKLTDECSATSGNNTIGYLYFQMKRNPQHLDAGTIVAACLVKKKVLPPSYSAQQYYKDAPNSTFPFLDDNKGAKALSDCSADPLSLLSAG